LEGLSWKNRMKKVLNSVVSALTARLKIIKGGMK